MIAALPPSGTAVFPADDDFAPLWRELAGARRVRSIDEPHLRPWLARWAECEAAPALFPPVDRRCDSFSAWWNRASRGLHTATDLLAAIAQATG